LDLREKVVQLCSQSGGGVIAKFPFLTLVLLYQALLVGFGKVLPAFPSDLKDHPVSNLLRGAVPWRAVLGWVSYVSAGDICSAINREGNAI
jgi:hypothetical protein